MNRKTRERDRRRKERKEGEMIGGSGGGRERKGINGEGDRRDGDSKGRK